MSENADRVQWAVVPDSPELWASSTGLIATLKYDGAGFQVLPLKMDQFGEMYVTVRQGENKKLGRRKVAAMVLAAFGKPSVGGTAIVYRDGDTENCALHNLSQGRKGRTGVGDLKPRRCLGHHCNHSTFMSSGNGNRLCGTCNKLNGYTGGDADGIHEPGEIPDAPSLVPTGRGKD